MEKNDFSSITITSEQLKKELEREKSKPKGSFFMGIIITLIIFASIISILNTLFFPLMRIKGDSMFPNLENGNFVVALKTDEFKRGDVCVFYSGQNILCKRIIAFGGEVVDIDSDGVVYINSIPLNEPYLTATDLGNANIKFPYLVPDHMYFVMGDNRSVSLDSRNTEIGCVSEGQVIGKIIFRFWPVNKIGVVD